MTFCICSHRLSMQSDVINDQQLKLSNETDCSPQLSTKLIYSGLKLQPKPIVSTISMSSMASPVSIVKKLSLADTNPDTSNKTIGSSIRHSTTSTTPSSIRLVSPATSKVSPPTTLQLQVVDKTSTSITNGTLAASKTYLFSPQQPNSPGSAPSPLVTLIPPGTTSPKIQTLISTHDLSNNYDHNNSKQSTFLAKNRVTLVQPIIASSPSSVSSSSAATPTTAISSFTPASPSTNSSTSKLLIQQNPTTNFWSQPPAKFFSATMLSRPVHLISSTEHSTLSSPTSNENPIFTTKTLDSGNQTFIHMSLLPSTSTTEPINSVQLTNFYPTQSAVRLSTMTQRSMDHNNNHSITTPTIREVQTDEKMNDFTVNRTVNHHKSVVKNRERLPLQPTTQQISSVLPTSKKHKLSDDEQISSSEPPNKVTHYERLDSTLRSKKGRKGRHKTVSHTALENTTPTNSRSLPSSLGSDPSGIIISKKRSSAEIAAAAILSSNSMRKRRVQAKNFDETSLNNNDIKEEIISNDDPSIETLSDELLKRLSQDFLYVDQRTGIRWIATKSRLQPTNKLLSRFSWKSKINHYEKYSDITRTNPKRTVPTKSLDVIQQKLIQPSASWRIDRLSSYLTDLTENEQESQNNLSDIAQLLNEIHIDDNSVRNSIKDLIEGNIQRHRYFREQITQISTLLVNLLDHGSTLREICSTSKLTTPNSTLTTLRRHKER